ncbi:bifunctional aspartate kinase/homoserine dehydrogenase I [Candidatus Sulfidibacterium hydrothermale]|uniref:bifunctional aspartate kinase/homoserine dehydrogenase I n=1 Tax=Candidatus Sulfidibacterium hydrothermale TaxID=2875962 RepID=UPI001F0A782D|nr:bifunctional aspartate kinase/homoserine dehydrogenase I [Candidatus Sulfidibacterium hydrothermale]UBM61685.1 bifunctional aspartate kinase/homoserine dehydrogenase I [Candidatus Sulfidibacterium hydrothermale]
MLVLKFGGSSVATAENVKRVIEIVRDKIKEEPSLIVVASAFGGITNLLDKSGEKARSGSEEYKSFLATIETRHMTMIEGLFPFKNQGEIKASVKMILNELEDICFGIFLLQEMNRRVHDRLLSFGERLSGKIISEAFRLQGIPINYQDARELIITEENWERIQVDFSETQKRIDRQLKNASFPVYVPGFIASTRSGIPSTLGRGGSDYTAALLAAMTGSRALEIWTDVDGVMTADPALVESAMPLSKLSYSELMEMSHFGAKVIFPPSIQPVMKKNIPVWIKNTFHPEVPGTLIDADGTENGHPVKGLSHIEGIVLLTITGGGMVGVTGTAARLFSCLSQQNVNVIFITQASSEHSITLAVSQEDAEKATKAIENEFAAERKLGLIDRLLIENGLSIVALVGDKMKSSLGLSGKAFDALGKNGINIRAIAQGSTEKNVSFVVKENDVVKTLNVLHERFFLSPFKKVHLFMVGVGNVGSALLEQIQRQYSCLKKEYALEIKVMAVANSRLMAFDDSGIELGNWKKQLAAQGTPMNKELFVQKMKAMNLRNSIFVDNTASHSIALLYEKILKASISVVASNKIAASGSYSTYKKLNDTALSMKKKFLYETNVGAGLPVLKTIRDMRKSGDKIFRIQAVLSGSLNFIFNHFTGETPFSEIVKLAREEGYTEPDPRIDLSGQDVMRKILILARESGYPLEPDEVSVVPFLPEHLMKADSVEKFMEELEKQNNSLEKQRQKAEKNQKKLRYVAEFNRGKAQVGLQMVDPDQPYYQLDGKDNIVLIFSQRYDEQPLVIKGAGAGAAVTASGVFADIISIVNQ